MKNYVFILLIAIALSSCGSLNYYIGMSEQEFKEENKFKDIKMVKATREQTIYEHQKMGWDQYIYFVNGELERIDEGTRRADIVIENK